METAKVDIQKLQLLNDRLAQTIDALNQVRMLAHGIQHTASSPWGYSAYGTPFGVVPQYWPYTSQFGVSPYSMSPWQVPFASPFGGIQHTSSPWVTSPYFGGYQTSPFTQTPYFSGIQHTSSPFATSPYFGGFQHTTPSFTSPFMAAFQQTTPFGTSPFSTSPFGTSPYGFQQTSPAFSQTPYVGNGISHSSWDPSLQMRSPTMPWA